MMHYDVPRGNREYACWPAVAELVGLIEHNRRLINSFSFDVLDIAAGEFRARTIATLADAAREYAARIGIGRPATLDRPIVATGHQADLHHAGVWIKNHLACRLAHAAGGSSLNLIVDNDVPKHLGILMPVRDGEKWYQKEAFFASRRAEAAFEEYPGQVEKPRRFLSETRRISAGMPHADEACRLAERLTASSGRGATLADVTSALRAGYETEVEIENCELPVSRLAATPVFAAFVASIIREARHFAGIYNKALSDYRSRHRVRNAANPLPDLAMDEETVEAPFWVWRAGGSRQRLKVHGDSACITLVAGAEAVGSLCVESFESAARSWSAIESSGVKIRPRALTNTIFMRLFASDLFIHGIGGAMYDEVTDQIIREFYGTEPPQYATVSATLTLDWDFEPVDPSDVGALKQAIREIDYNPQRHIENRGPTCGEAALIDEKWRLVRSTPDTRKARRKKFQRIREINSRLAERLVSLREGRLRQLRETTEKLERDRVAFAREYPCFLLGAERVAEFYAEVLAPLAAKSSS